MQDILILTAITGNYDYLHEPSRRFDNCDYIAYVDKFYPNSIWKQLPIIDFSFIDLYKNRRNAKIFKIISSIIYPKYKYIIWHDGNVALNEDPNKLIEDLGDNELYLYKHPERNCAFKEIEVAQKLNIDIKGKLLDQDRYLKSKNFPKNYGLYHMSAFVKKNCPAINRLDLLWWEQICRFSSRDQISFPFCLWRLEDDLRFKIFGGNLCPSNYLNNTNSGPFISLGLHKRC